MENRRHKLGEGEAAFGPAPDTGRYNRATQRWEFAEDAPQMTVVGY